mmetsp:Transcript_38719/g.54032  ORF Transcript_38719/g.54032 Transcript_38719/m.54032 type:complete len:215 (-) Transcript_38719:896-1540(-)
MVTVLPVLLLVLALTVLLLVLAVVLALLARFSGLVRLACLLVDLLGRLRAAESEQALLRRFLLNMGVGLLTGILGGTDLASALAVSLHLLLLLILLLLLAKAKATGDAAESAGRLLLGGFLSVLVLTVRTLLTIHRLLLTEWVDLSNATRNGGDARTSKLANTANACCRCTGDSLGSTSSGATNSLGGVGTHSSYLADASTNGAYATAHKACSS